MKIKTLMSVLLLFFFVSGTIYSQKKKTDVEVIDFGDGGKSSPKAAAKYNNAIVKINPFSIIYGRAFVEYERELQDWVSVQGGVGLTFQPFLESSLFSSIADLDFEDFDFCDSKLWVNDRCDNHILSDKEYRKGSPGYLANISIRLFPASDGFDGGYFSVVGGYTQYRFKGRKAVETRNNFILEEDYTTPETASYLDGIVRYGYQTLHPKLTTESFIGAGLRKKFIKMTDIGQDANFVYRNGIAEYNATEFLFQAGIRIGFQL